MECGEQCVVSGITGITMMPELCADNWDTMSTQVEVCKLYSFIRKRIGEVTRSQMLSAWQ